MAEKYEPNIKKIMRYFKEKGSNQSKSNEEFNKKAAAHNKTIVSEEAVSKFKKAEADRKASIQSKLAMNPNSPKAKRTQTEKTNASGYENEMEGVNIPKSTTTTTTVTKAVSEAKPAAKSIDGVQGRDKPDNTGKSLAAGLSAFGKAFKEARAKGEGTKFAFNDKMYAAVTKDDVSRSGKSNLPEYLNSLKRQSTEIAKAPGQMKKGGMVVARGNKIARSKPTKLY